MHHKHTPQQFMILPIHTMEIFSGTGDERIYLDRGRKQDYGRFWAAIFALKSSVWLSDHLQECFWYNGNDKENLITEFMRH